jgi:hypothetical protein
VITHNEAARSSSVMEFDRRVVIQRCRLLLSLPGSAQVDSASTSTGQRARLNQLCGHVAKLCVGSLRSVDEYCD